MPGGGEYTSVVTTATDESTQLPREPGAINGGMVQRDETTPTPVITIDVDAIDDALKDVEASGGVTLAPQDGNPGHGGVRLLQGSGGQLLGLWETTS